MTGRIIRTGNAQSRAAPTAPLRTARRTDVPPPRPEPTPRPAPPARRAPPVNVVQGTRNTTVSTHQGRSTVSEHGQDERLFEFPIPDGREPARVSVSFGRTVNMGNFEFVRIDVSVSLPCMPDDVPAAYDRAVDFVVDKLEAEEQHFGAQPRGRTGNQRGR